MNISMTCGDILLNVGICLVTGLVTGWFVTKYYRNKDKSIEVSKYFTELAEYVWGLYDTMSVFNRDESEDKLQCIESVILYCDKELPPFRYKWMKVSTREEELIHDTDVAIGRIKNSCSQYLKSDENNNKETLLESLISDRTKLNSIYQKLKKERDKYTV